jgi:hypothetical protein
MTDWRSCLRSDPTPWLLENACPPIRYRVLEELLDRGRDDPDLQKARQDALAYGPAVQLQRKQRKDGSWGGRIHASDARKLEPSLENLIKADPRRERYHRWFLRILALGLLARAGYVDGRSRSGVLELLELASGFVDSPVARDPTEEIGAAHPLIRREVWRNGYLFVPDHNILRAFAFSPWLLDGEMAKMRLKKVFDYVLSSTYQELAPELGLVRTDKGSFLKQYGIRLYPLDHYQRKGSLDELLTYLELFARLGLINRYPLLMSHLEWLQSQQGKDGRWNLPTKLLSDNSRWTHLLRIEQDWRSPTRKEADITFRVLLILRHQWQRQIRMLDRRDDAYPI